MSDKKQAPAKSATKAAAHVKTPAQQLFTKENYTWMIGGIIIVALGMFLMAGGKSDDPNQFNQKEVYSTTRITVAPFLICLGLGLEIVALFRKPKQNSESADLK
jgi:hypothetical protein